MKTKTRPSINITPLAEVLATALGLAARGQDGRAEGVLKAAGFVRLEDCETKQLHVTKSN